MGRPRKLGWLASWLNGVGGLCFFVGCLCSFSDSALGAFWLTEVPSAIGSVSYLIGSVMGLLMWKLQQFGGINLPQLNVNPNMEDVEDLDFEVELDSDAEVDPLPLDLDIGTTSVGSYDSGGSRARDRLNVARRPTLKVHNFTVMMDEDNRAKMAISKDGTIVMYRDVAFICLYVVTFGTAVSAISYSFLCPQREDMIKNFLLACLASVVLLGIASFMHREPEKPPFTYILWFMRAFMSFYTINLFIDTWHLSGTECEIYGQAESSPLQDTAAAL